MTWVRCREYGHQWSEPGEVKPQEGGGHSITQVCQRCYTERETYVDAEGQVDPLAATYRQPGGYVQRVAARDD